MKFHSFNPLAFVFLFLLSPLLPSYLFAATPDSIGLSIGQASISRDDIVFEPLVESGGVFSLNKTSNNRIAFNDAVPTGRYRTIMLSIEELSWSVEWDPDTNPSPCPGDLSSGASGIVDLGGKSDFYFKTASTGGNTLQYYLENPPVSGYAGDFEHPLLLGQPVDVHKDSFTSIDLVFGVSDSLVCDGIAIFNAGLMAGPNNSSPQRVISGPSSRLNGLSGLVVDSPKREISATNLIGDRVSFFRKGDLGDFELDRFIEGPATRLNAPASISMYFNPGGIANDGEVIVANFGNSSITAYERFLSPNPDFRVNQEPIRTLGGLNSGIDRPVSVFYDVLYDEIITLNAGNNSITSHPREVQGDSIPRRIISDGFLVNSRNNVLSINESGGEGVVSAVIPEKLYINGSELANELDNALDRVTSVDTDILVLFDGVTGLFTLSVQSLGSGVDHINLLWSDSRTTADRILGFDNSFDSGSLLLGMMDVSDFPHISGVSLPCALITDPNSNEIIVSNEGDNSILFLSREASIKGRVFPLRKIQGPSTGLDKPCGLYWDKGQNVLIVANQGNNSVVSFDPVDFLAFNNSEILDISPLQTLSGDLTRLNEPSAVGILQDQLIVGGRLEDSAVPQPEDTTVHMPHPPPIHITSANPMGTSLSPLKGKYNTLVFGINYKGVNHLGRAMHEVFSESSLVEFFPEGFSPLIEWPVFTLDLNRRITREVISPDCRVLTNDDPGTFWTGFFGTRDDGRFYAFLPGVGGSFQGAVSADGSMFAGAMIDHPRGHWIIIGFRDTGSNIPFLTQTGVAGGAPAHYALATYFLDLFIVGRPENNDTIRTQLSIESAFTESENNDRFFVGASGSSNFVTILNPFGLVTVPQSPGPVYRDNIGSISVFDVFYQSMAGGIFQLEREGLSGGILSDGSAFNFIRNTNISSNGSCQDELGRDIGFGLSLRQKPAGTYSVGNFSGSYIMAGIGDRYDFDLTANRFFSTLHRFFFNGIGGVTLETLINEAGHVQADYLELEYRVSQRLIPEQGSFQEMTDVLEFYFHPDRDPIASALIVRDGSSLSFFRSLSLENESNPARLLGLALKQHP